MERGGQVPAAQELTRKLAYISQLQPPAAGDGQRAARAGTPDRRALHGIGARTGFHYEGLRELFRNAAGNLQRPSPQTKHALPC